MARISGKIITNVGILTDRTVKIPDTLALSSVDTVAVNDNASRAIQTVISVDLAITIDVDVTIKILVIVVCLRPYPALFALAVIGGQKNLAVRVLNASSKSSARSRFDITRRHNLTTFARISTNAVARSFSLTQIGAKSVVGARISIARRIYFTVIAAVKDSYAFAGIISGASGYA